jgi:hypothetical protein
MGELIILKSRAFGQPGRYNQCWSKTMTYTARVEKGAIVLDGNIQLPDGTRLKVEQIPDEPKDNRTVWEALRELDGKATGLPPDFAENHDHYIHGAPKGIDKK